MSKLCLRTYGTIAILLGAWGCAQAEAPSEEPIATKQCPVTYSTGDELVALGFLQFVMGRGLNGVDLNGSLLDGTHVAYVQLDSAIHGGKPMGDVVLEESKFRGRTASGKNLINNRFEDVHFTAHTDAGDTVELAIRNARRWLEPGMTDTFLYEVEYLVEGGWQPLCGAGDGGGAIEAIALRGRWDYREGVEGGGDRIDDPNAFTFACMGHAAAKCVQMGYKPWREALVCHIGEGCAKQSIGHLHQACTRMLRGDYCGDGTAHTIDGMQINVYDGYGIRYDADDWDIEAEWTPEGASCLARARMADMPSLSCAESLVRTDCGDTIHFVEGASLISEIPSTF